MIVGATPEALTWGTGTGNSPPARKLASWPLRATRLGSARIFSRPFCRRAVSENSKLASWKMPKTVVFAPCRGQARGPVEVIALDADSQLGRSSPGNWSIPAMARADDAAGAGIDAQEVGTDAPHGCSVELGDPNLEHDLLRAHDAEEVDDLGRGAAVADWVGPPSSAEAA